ncbi:MAG: homogentisate 1,2-dioxygenase [Vampirovibrionales bacterium]
MRTQSTPYYNKGRTTRQSHLQLPEGCVEEEHGRDGFFGPVSQLYRTQAPTGWTRIEGPLKPRAFDCNRLGVSDFDAVTGRTSILFNNDVTVFVSQPNTPTMDYFFRNADGDEVIFVHRGEGCIETDYGPLTFRQGDYLVIPRGTLYRVVAEHPPFLMIFETAGRIQQPDRGMLGIHALYDQTALDTPEPEPSSFQGITGPNGITEWEVRIKRQGQITSVWYPFNPLNVVGWKGDLTPFQLNIMDICPVISHKAHLPPSVHTTFLAQNLVICSFVPRPLESEPGALKVPFYHSNIDFDEVLFYHDGDFFSRDGIDAGMITFHPQGIHHGPHPEAYKASWDPKKDWTNEVAVMLDTRYPLTMTQAAHSTEWPEYYMSWQPKEASATV